MVLGIDSISQMIKLTDFMSLALVWNVLVDTKPRSSHFEQQKQKRS
jgi:hypothetical protein